MFPPLIFVACIKSLGLGLSLDALMCLCWDWFTYSIYDIFLMDPSNVELRFKFLPYAISAIILFYNNLYFI